MLPGGITVLMICATFGPPNAFCTATLLMPYSNACRTFTLAMAPFASGLRRLNTRYGTVSLHGQTWNFGSLLASSCGIAVGSTVTSCTRSKVLAFSSASWVCADETPIVSVIFLTYWCLSGSADCFQAGLSVITSDLPGRTELIW